MKNIDKFIISLVFTAATLASFADPAGQTELEKKMSRREVALQRMYNATGGMIDRPHSTGGKFAFINMQKAVPVADIEEPVATIVRILRHDVTLEESAEPGEFTIADVQKRLSRQSVKGGIFLIEDAVLPTLLVAPESGWGIINVGKLAADAPDKLLLGQRVRREMWRCFAMVNGGANTRMGNCVLQTVLSLKDLDGLGAEAFCPEPLNQILEHLDALGVKKYQRTTYKQACIEGWAPAPTNDVQKAIWDKVHSIPDKPITIEFDPKRDK